jgi:hypothetical protein
MTARERSPQRAGLGLPATSSMTILKGPVSRRVFASVLWFLGLWILATSRLDEPSLDEWRQMGAVAAHWESGKPVVSMAAMAIGVLLWKSKPTDEPGSASQLQ